ncbi:hypothetical protein EMIHUDRAFT_240534 [Emiliania huxleyi CCMP1516]|uniref:Uncharacterized protein n=2 Tax=Emiliania huxleyi TaxID=2903 RepID=A0A0D3JF21_EMIH1|nr:hypothetical protein EMIHUDRAFT_240534 [Emiliania huxleyi CCMP1516]EOD22106.1 hypothetical protein EMIHUDRAFT_240534 [Emiliania huxleyi CCMP1516]|eukprot:XP_005774535.1 hypothetical protein EMIHUDRAFT_240534 [Emiliania huxleyi CCMP1516]
MRLDSLPSRRAAVSAALLASCASLPRSPPPAFAFENRLPPDELELKYKQPRTAGPQPTDLGVRAGGALKPCTDGKPHCFSSSPESFDGYEDAADEAAGWLVQPFRFDMPLADAVADVKEAIVSYPPGQRGIDGGGFRVVKESTSAQAAYIYVQYESRRKGFVDDMEFALANGVVNVRTSSRLGYLDMGVNAKRFTWFAERLGAQRGWKTVPLRAKGHEEYFALNGITDKDIMSS